MHISLRPSLSPFLPPSLLPSFPLSLPSLLPPSFSPPPFIACLLPHCYEMLQPHERCQAVFLPSLPPSPSGLIKPSVTLSTLTPTYNHYFMATPTSFDARSCCGATAAPSNHAVKRYHGDGPSGHAVNRYHGDALSSQVMVSLAMLSLQ